MPDPNERFARRKCKLIVFGATVIVAIILIVVLIVHRSSNRSILCENSGELFYIQPDVEAGNNNETGECYPSNGSRGPCPSTMILMPLQTNKSVGVCDCDNSERVSVYHDQTNQCYSIFTQGYCTSSEYLTLDKDGTQRCQENKCLSQNNEHPGSSEWVPLKDGTCIELGKSHPTCRGSNEVMQFFPYKIYPACSYTKSKVPDFAGVGVPPSKCPKGYSRTSFGHCALDFDFD